MASSPTNVDKAHKKVISHAHSLLWVGQGWLPQNAASSSHRRHPLSGPPPAGCSAGSAGWS
eukprot:311629-Hanusia_phi.AAC.1